MVVQAPGKKADNRGEKSGYIILTLNDPHGHPTLNLLPKMVENNKHTRWMALLERPRGH